MVQTAEVRDARDRADPKDRTAVWRVLVKGEVRAGVVVIARVRGQHVPQMRFVEDDQMVEALTPDGADQPLDIRVLPRAARRDRPITDAHRSDPPLEWLAI
jgi:hypothetical protein